MRYGKSIGALAVAMWSASCTPPLSGASLDAQDAEPTDSTSLDAGLDAGRRESADAGTHDTGQSVNPTCAADGIRLRAVAPTYGGFRPEEARASLGLAAVLSDRHIVFGERRDPYSEGTELVLVEVEADTLRIVDTATSSAQVATQMGGAQNWTDPLGGFLVPMGASRFALVAGRSSIEVYEVSDAGMRRTHALPLLPAPSGSPIFGAVARGDRIFVCETQGLASYRVGATEIVRAPSTAPAFACGDLARSPNGQRLVSVSRTRGLVVLDADRFPLAIVDDIRDVGAYVDVAASDTAIAALEIRTAGEPAPVIVYGMDGTRWGTLEPTTNSLPVGVAFVGDDLLVSWVSFEQGRPRLEVRLTRVEPGRLQEVGRNTVRRGSKFESRPIGTLAPPVTGAELAVAFPYRSVLAINGDGAFVSITGPGHGAPQDIARVAPKRVVARGLFSFFGWTFGQAASGGRASPDLPALLSLRRGAFTEWWFPDTGDYELDPEARLGLLTLDADLPRLVDTVPLNGGPARLSGGRQLVSTRTEPDGSLVLNVYGWEGESLATPQTLRWMPRQDRGL